MEISVFICLLSVLVRFSQGNVIVIIDIIVINGNIVENIREFQIIDTKCLDCTCTIVVCMLCYIYK